MQASLLLLLVAAAAAQPFEGSFSYASSVFATAIRDAKIGADSGYDRMAPPQSGAHPHTREHATQHLVSS